MAFRRICVALLLSCLPAAGCGTVANLTCSHPEEPGKSPFGGVRRDMNCIEKAANGEFTYLGHSKSEPVQHPQVAPMLVCAADLPLSLIGDVLTWPYTAGYTFVNEPVPVPPVIVAPLSPLAPAQEKGPAVETEPKAKGPAVETEPKAKGPAVETEPKAKLPQPRRVEPIVPQPSLPLLPTISSDDTGRAGPN